MSRTIKVRGGGLSSANSYDSSCFNYTMRLSNCLPLILLQQYTGEGHKESKKKVKEDGIVGISKVVGLSKLKTKYESFEAKRQLCNSYDLFVADERVLGSLPKLIGKSFFKKKKQPIPVRLTGKDWASQVRKACEATYLFFSGGSSLTIKVAKTSQTEGECVDNFVEAVKGVVEHVPKKWSGVKALYIKTAQSVALPVYQAEEEAAPIKIP